MVIPITDIYPRAEKFLNEALKKVILYNKISYTLEINKIEAAFQKPDEPPVYIKKYDGYGFVSEVEQNPTNIRQAPVPANNLNESDAILFGQKLVMHDRNLVGRIHLLIADGEFQRFLSDKINYEKPPGFIRQIDEEGYITSLVTNKYFKE